MVLNKAFFKALSFSPSLCAQYMHCFPVALSPPPHAPL